MEARIMLPLSTKPTLTIIIINSILSRFSLTKKLELCMYGIDGEELESLGKTV
jgi:hypothetical protein